MPEQTRHPNFAPTPNIWRGLQIMKHILSNTLLLHLYCQIFSSAPSSRTPSGMKIMDLCEVTRRNIRRRATFLFATHEFVSRLCFFFAARFQVSRLYVRKVLYFVFAAHWLLLHKFLLTSCGSCCSWISENV
jgi:hypothetical protein